MLSLKQNLKISVKDKIRENVSSLYYSESMNWFHKLENEFWTRKEMFERMFYWAWKLRWNFDFDAQTLYQIQYLKLKRVHECMLKHGHLDWNSSPDHKHMRRLAEARELARRLTKNNFDKHSMYVYTNFFFEREGEDYLYLRHREKYPHAKLIPYRKYRFYSLKAHERDEAYHQYVKRRFYTLLEKYQEHWWD